ncbi:protein disulfide-isomerase A5-like [Scleropages formosus]|uniref:protein disulfide-isomerase A5-like n=1 Tax=Scleropages formosus TaxID=113540 RepID=UPI0010FA660F|nr:protein disulfide-isomerase A5-like [Scleropages formosus]
MYLFVLAVVWAVSALEAAQFSPLTERITDHKDFRKLLRTRTNVLVIYTKTVLSLSGNPGDKAQGVHPEQDASTQDSDGRKLCKKMKVEPSSESTGVKMLHYKDGTFHIEYTRPVTFKSLVAFLMDPTGDPLWEENPEAKDITHIGTEEDLRQLLKKEERPIFIMFYAPWCPVCKQMQPVFQQAATNTRGTYVLAGMNVHPAEFDGLKQEYNIKAYPTFCYFEKGKFLYNYENYDATAKDIVDWMKSPLPPQPEVPEVPWPETDSAVHHLTNDTFDTFLDEHPFALVMFYAPWCGHCKKMKPEYDEAAKLLNKDNDSPGVLAAVDATVHRALGERYNIPGFPTLKYFENGEDKYTLADLRTKDEITEWLDNPQAPPPPEPSWEDKPSSVIHLRAENFHEALKKKKHTLVMFYAPWCPHSKEAIPHFTAAAEVLKEDRKVSFAAVDCTEGHNSDMCGQEGVEAYPTFNCYNYGKFAEKYSGERREEDFTGLVRRLREKDQHKVAKRKEEL